MNKYSKEFKMRVIKYCLEEHHGVKRTAKHFNLPTKTTVQQWVRKYQEHGINGLSSNCCRYSRKAKENVVEYMYKNHLSLTETAIKFNLGSHHVVEKWEEMYKNKEFPNRKENKKLKDKKMKKDNEKALREEIEQLRMENEYLKKLNALVQKRIKQENKKK